MQTLTKEYIWDEVKEKYPQGFKVFADWIDEYKKRVKWNLLFNSNSEYQNADGKNAKAPKYHDLPLGMQIGIWMEFVNEVAEYSWDIEDVTSYDWKAEISDVIKMLEDHIIEEELS